MNYKQIKKLKAEMVNTHKKYKSEKNKLDKLITLANLFHIELGCCKYDVTHVCLDLEERYIIQNINIDKLTIEILDQKENILYKSIYIGDGLFEITIISEDINVTYRYDCNREIKIDEQISVRENNYELLIDKKTASLDKQVKLVYFKTTKIKTDRFGTEKSGPEYEKVIQPLITKIYKLSDREEKEHCFTYCFDAYEVKGDIKDKYFYLTDSNIIYGINNATLEQGNVRYCGVCMKRALKNRDSFEKYRCCNIDNFDSMYEKDVISAMIFKGVIYPNNYELEILVKEDSYYVVLKNIKYDSLNQETVNISTYGIDRKKDLISSLSKLNLEFINIVIPDIEEFLLKIATRRKNTPSLIDITDPKTYLNLDIKQVSKRCFKDKGSILELFDKQYLSMANLENGKQKTIRKD